MSEKKPARKLRKNKSLGQWLEENLGTFVKAIHYGERINGDHELPGAQRLELAVEYLNGLIDIPGVPEWLEEQLFKIVVSLIVEFSKQLWGEQDWFVQLMTVFGLSPK